MIPGDGPSMAQERGDLELQDQMRPRLHNLQEVTAGDPGRRRAWPGSESTEGLGFSSVGSGVSMGAGAGHSQGRGVQWS